MTTIVSAPGKVLLAGGYLVLDPTYSGLVVATSSRFYCIIRPSPLSSSRLSTNSSSGGISVRAGQFPEDVSTWRYSVSAKEHGLEITGEGEGKNKFVEITVRNALTVVVESLAASGEGMAKTAKDVVNKIQGDGGGLEIVVLADNDFYSQRESLTAMSLPPLISSLDALPPFNPLPRAIHLTNKTGLGSSAALVTSLTAALLSHFGIVSIPTSPSPTFTSSPSTSTSTSPAGQTLSGDFDLIHNLAQFSHCLAQGKVGSGFDISSAVYGSHLYRRFSPKVLAPLMEQSSSSSSAPLLPALDRSKWDHQTTPFALPKGLRLMLADVDAGTDTPSFVGKVLKWREANKVEADELWGSLGRANDGLGELLRELAAKSGEEGYEGVLREAAGKAIDSLDIARPASQPLVRIRASLTLIRSYLQHMSTLSGVPIEPTEQTRLLDACSALPGVIGGGVPGAGGYDAIFLLIIDSPEVVAGVEKVWSSWTEMSVCPLSARQSDGGLQRESMEDVRGLKERLGW